MKKFFCLFLIFICFSSCNFETSQNDTINIETPEYVFTMSHYFTEKPHVFSVFPEIHENKIFYCDQYNYVYSNEEDIEGNVFYIDLDKKEEKAINTFSNKLHFYNNNLYYNKNLSLCKTDITSGETIQLLSFDMNNLYCFSSGNKNYLVYWESNKDYTDIKLYSYNIETNQTELIGKTNYLTSPYHTFKIRNNHIAYAEKKGDKYIVYGYNIESKEKLEILQLSNEPSQMVFDGKIFVWSDKTGTHVFNNGEDILIGRGTADVDIFKNRYIFFFENFKIRIYDLYTDKIIYFSEKKYSDTLFIQWFSLDDTGEKAAFIGIDPKLCENIYTDVTFESHPEIIFVMDIALK